MRTNLGEQSWMFPFPVLIIASYDENGQANAMNAAWGSIYGTNQVMLSLGKSHKTTGNIKKTGAFTINFADSAHVVAADYVGLVSANAVADKMERAGFHTIKSAFVNAPIITELPIAMECKLIKVNEDGNIIGEIVNISADEQVLGSDGLIDTAKADVIVLEPIHDIYLRLGEKVGNAFHDGEAFK